MGKILLILGAGLLLWFFISRGPTEYICRENDMSENCIVLTVRSKLQTKTAAMIEFMRYVEADKSLFPYEEGVEGFLKRCRETANVAVIYGGQVKDTVLESQGLELRPLCERIPALAN